MKGDNLTYALANPPKRTRITGTNFASQPKIVYLRSEFVDSNNPGKPQTLSISACDTCRRRSHGISQVLGVRLWLDLVDIVEGILEGQLPDRAESCFGRKLVHFRLVEPQRPQSHSAV